MKKPAPKKPLQLSTTTVRTLQEAQLARIAGGYYSSLCPNQTSRCEITYRC
jgi:hypothetical protein